MKKVKQSFSEDFRLVGKSIKLHQPNQIEQHTSLNHQQCDKFVKSPIRYCQRINQLYSTICSHEIQLKHEIANHFKDRNVARKLRQKSKRTMATKIIQQLKDKKSNSCAVVTATNAFKLIQRKRKHWRRFPIKQRQTLQIPSITFPR